MNVPYNDIVQMGNSKMIIHARQEMAKRAELIGSVATAKEYGVDVRTVKKWHLRWKNGESLENKSSRPHGSPMAMKRYWLMLIVDKAQRELLRLTAHRASASKPIVISATWLKRTHKIPYSTKTILKMLHVYGLKRVRPHKAKRTKSDEVFKRKQLLPALYYWQVDIKELRDIHGYAHWINRIGVPKYQITARDVKTGALFIGFCREKTVTNTELFVDVLLGHLKGHGIDTTKVHVQTDNGSEFVTPIRCDHASAFTVLVHLKYGATHTLIPIGQKNYQADVESSHRLIEEEFYQPHQVITYAKCLAAANRYIRYFNTRRHNSYKGASPQGMLEKSMSTISVSVFDWSIPECDRLLTRTKMHELRALHERARATGLQQQICLSMRKPFELPALPNEEMEGEHIVRAA